MSAKQTRLEIAKHRHQWSVFKIMIHHDVSSSCFIMIWWFLIHVLLKCWDISSKSSINSCILNTPNFVFQKKKRQCQSVHLSGWCDSPQLSRWTSRRRGRQGQRHLFFLFIISRSSTSDMSTCETWPKTEMVNQEPQQVLPQFALVLNFGFFFWGWTRRCFFFHNETSQEPMIIDASLVCIYRIHGTGIFTYMYHNTNLTHVGKYTSPMDPMDHGMTIGILSDCKLSQEFRTSFRKKTQASWWFQPIWKILVKLGIFPR